MTAELRWILLLLGLPLLIGIWWWGARRSSQAPGDAALREPSAGDSARHESVRRDSMPHDSVHQDPAGASAARGWGVPPFEPLSIRTADFESVPVLDGPMLVAAPHVDALTPVGDSEPSFSKGAFDTAHDMGPHLLIRDETAAMMRSERAEPAQSLRPPAQPPPAEAPSAVVNPAPLAKPLLGVKPATGAPPALQSKPTSGAQSAPLQDDGGRATAASRPPQKAEKQRIVTVRVCAPGEVRWSGATLLNAFELHGLAYGRYNVFHRKHVDGQSVFCAASLVEPGTFDVERMPAQQFRGITLFAVLPGPVEPLLTVDELLSAARGLAAELSGMIQDSKGLPMSPQRAAALRDDIARFQAALSVA